MEWFLPSQTYGRTDKDEMKRLVIALAELDLTIDEWLCFKMKELILADRLSKENRGEE